MQIMHLGLDGGKVPATTVNSTIEIVSCDTSEIEVVLLDNGTSGGKSSVAIFAKMPDGRMAFVQLTAANFHAAAKEIAVRLQQRGEL